jgi:Transposase DDE domain
MKATQSRHTHDSLFDVLRPVIKLDARHLVVLVALVLAVIDRRTSVLNSLKTHVQLPGSPEVRKKRLSRLMQCQLPEHLLIHLVLPLLVEGHLELTLDRTNWKFGVVDINFLILGMYWKGTSLPLLWTLLPHSGNSTQAERCTLINRFLVAFQSYTDTHRISGLLADREFIGKDWFRFLRRKHIPVCIRLKSNTLVNGQPIHHRFKYMNPGQIWSQSTYPVTVYGVKVYLAACFTPKGEVLYLATASRHSTTALAQYARRWGAECLHQALKGRGFNFEDTHLVHPERLSVLLVVLSIALIWCCCSGEQSAQEVEIKVLAHGRPEKSLFRHGLDAIQEAIKHFGDGRLEALASIFARSRPWKYRVLLGLNAF